MQQHAGAPCKPLVQVGDEVLVGQKIADSDAVVSAPIHASVSGKVHAVNQVMLSGGQYVDALVIDSDGEMKVSPEVHPPKVDTREEFLPCCAGVRLGWIGRRWFSYTCQVECIPR